MLNHRLKVRMAAVTLPILIALAMATGASAATSTSVADIYNAPSSLPSGNGTLVKYASSSANLGSGSPGVKVWRTQYTSTKIDGTRNVVSGTVFVPTASWDAGFLGLNPRPVIAYAVGTHGLGPQCAPSKQLADGTDYEIANIVAALKKGYAVVVTDNDGYVSGATPSYIVGGNAARALLDGVRSAFQIPSVGLKSSTKVGIWGYSQGGQTAAAAGEIEASYASELNVVGVAAGGVPADLRATAAYLDGRNGEAFMLSAIYGLAQQYPSAINLNTLANANGQATIAQAKTYCVFQALFTFMNHSLSEYTVGNQSLAQLLAQPAIGAAVDAQKLGAKKIPVPVYLYHGKADEFIPLAQSLQLKSDYCGKGTNVTYDTYPSEHIATQFQAAPEALDFLGDRFNGGITLGTCITLRSKPTSTANSNTGNYVISMNKWPLSGKVGLKLLGQDVTLPSGGTFSADADVTAQQLKNATLSVPTFDQNLWITLLPVTVRLQLDTKSVTGSVSVDNNGQLHIHGNADVVVKVNSLGEGSLVQIPVGCETSSAVKFPLNYDGPVSDLGNGKVSFSGSTTFPSMTNCGLMNLVLTGLMSGPGQTYAFTVSPPDSVLY
ncbi:MAG: lipase family protein [Solirubrobacterales bacterium]